MKYRAEIKELLQMIYVSEQFCCLGAEKLDKAELSRFLNYQSTQRNRFKNEFLEVVETDQSYNASSNCNINEIFEESNQNLRSNNDTAILQICLSKDQLMIDKCLIILEERLYPIDVLEVVVRIMTFLIFQSIKGNKILNILSTKKTPIKNINGSQEYRTLDYLSN
ncbi:hypothetical protein [Aquimarina algicola]|uniref:DUF892 family protein n=1 Tax=Aquimarina algicola TaxID=2589995 RepID=A0A504JA76_9FLAO|nr:hypothetical protein [Aquimarina algicola]TPN84453.1 hypothetical protein FHK87_16100 [Aquimarina algicola]